MRGLYTLLKRVFNIYGEICPHCGGSVKIIAAIQNPSAITRILAHLGLPIWAPPRAPRALSITSQQPDTSATPHKPGSHSPTGNPLCPTLGFSFNIRHIHQYSIRLKVLNHAISYLRLVYIDNSTCFRYFNHLMKKRVYNTYLYEIAGEYAAAAHSKLIDR
jgi:hypothetical protein